MIRCNVCTYVYVNICTCVCVQGGGGGNIMLCCGVVCCVFGCKQVGACMSMRVSV